MQKVALFRSLKNGSIHHYNFSFYFRNLFLKGIVGMSVNFFSFFILICSISLFSISTNTIFSQEGETLELLNPIQVDNETLTFIVRGNFLTNDIVNLYSNEEFVKAKIITSDNSSSGEAQFENISLHFFGVGENNLVVRHERGGEFIGMSNSFLITIQEDPIFDEDNEESDPEQGGEQGVDNEETELSEDGEIVNDIEGNLDGDIGNDSTSDENPEEGVEVAPEPIILPNAPTIRTVSVRDGLANIRVAGNFQLNDRVVLYVNNSLETILTVTHLSEIEEDVNSESDEENNVDGVLSTVDFRNIQLSSIYYGKNTFYAVIDRGGLLSQRSNVHEYFDNSPTVYYGNQRLIVNEQNNQIPKTPEELQSEKQIFETLRNSITQLLVLLSERIKQRGDDILAQEKYVLLLPNREVPIESFEAGRAAQGLRGPVILPKPEYLIVKPDEVENSLPTKNLRSRDVVVNEVAEILGTVKPIYTEPLVLGDVDEQVYNLQVFLNNSGFSIATEGPGSPGNETAEMTPETVSALKAFQIVYGLQATGVFDNATADLILKL